ncbi:peptidoglycan-binding protein [Spirillospora sp. CA-294931]|uniref:peptidoglycan-binding protein n=1 Tax=Spirillospora sp. CA-294931 TaxID=3240042 RepID=UPI003D8B8A8F
MGTPAEMLTEARKSLGLGEPNHIQKWYLKNIDKSLGDWNWAWCDAAITYWAWQSGNAKEVCPKGGRAYTVLHAQDFQKLGKWFTGTAENLKKSKPGDIVFFDWGTTNNISAIDHVGIIEKNLGDGRVQTIEGNTGNACKRRVRGAAEVAGFGRPAYDNVPSKPAPPKPSKPKPAPKPSKAPNFPGVYLQYPPMRKTAAARQWQEQVRKRGWRIDADGVYGPASKSACRAFQKEKGLAVDGIVGPNTWRLTWEAPIT